MAILLPECNHCLNPTSLLDVVSSLSAGERNSRSSELVVRFLKHHEVRDVPSSDSCHKHGSGPVQSSPLIARYLRLSLCSIRLSHCRSPCGWAPSQWTCIAFSVSHDAECVSGLLTSRPLPAPILPPFDGKGRAMERIDGNGLGVAKGSLMLFSDFETGGAMWTGEGPRLVRRTVRFSRPFRAAPTMFVTPEMWDYDSSANIRGDLTAEEITGESADIVFKVWSDTRIARLRVAWIAFGPLPHHDDWTL